MLQGATGKPGDTVAVNATLTAGNAKVAAAAADITYETSQLSVATGADGQPDCEVASVVAAKAGPAKQLQSRVLPGSSANESTLRIAVFGLNDRIIPPGALFTCKFKISSSATPGAKTLRYSPDASDPDGIRIPIPAQKTDIMVEASK